MRDAAGVQYTSIWSRLLAWLLFAGPLKLIDRWQTNLAQAQLEQIMGEANAPAAISASLILRGRPQSRSALAIPSSFGESK